MVYAARPDFSIQIAMNADPNDPLGVPIWNDRTALVRSFSGYARGAQYELGQPLAADPSLVFKDSNEDLNNENTSSPFYPYVLPYRELCWQGKWPQIAGNLLNAKTWQPNDFDVVDPTFESYAVGHTPTWINAVGVNVTPVVGATGPHGGAKDLEFTVPATSAGSHLGANWTPATMPGRTYTASAYVQQSAAGTIALDVKGLTYGADVFQRTVSNGWGNPGLNQPMGDGGAWTINAGSVADYSVTPGAAQILSAAVNTDHIISQSNVQAPDFQQSVIIKPLQAMQGDALQVGLLSKYSVASDYYYLGLLVFHSDMSVTVEVWQHSSGVDTQLASNTLPTLYTVGDEFGLFFTVDGSNVNAEAWKLSLGRNTSTLAGVSNGTLGSGNTGGAGVMLYAFPGVTNPSPGAQFRNYAATCTRRMASTTTVGGPSTRLSGSFMADQPATQIRVVTVGTPTIGSVISIDDIQLEEAATASAFTTSGPVIYPVVRGLMERYVKQYLDNGYTGYVTVPVVDAQAALTGISIPTEYVLTLLSMAPEHWWPLSGGSTSTAWPDLSGNGGPPMLVKPPKSGTFTPPASGAGMSVPGDQGGTGVQFPQDPDGQCALLGVGSANGTHPPTGGAINFPSNPQFGAWEFSVAFWQQSPVFKSGDPIANNLVTFQRGDGQLELCTMGYNGSTGNDSVYFQISTPTGAINPTASVKVSDGNPHHWVAVVKLNPNAIPNIYSVKLYIDGVQVASGAGSTATLGTITIPATGALVGGLWRRSAGIMYDQTNATIDHVSTWSQELLLQDVTKLYNAGLGNPGTTTGARVVEHLSLSGFSPRVPSRISTGQTVLGPPSYSGSIDLLTDSLNSKAAELGAFWVAPDGATVFEDRNDRFFRTVPMWTLGENFAGGEVPYLDIQFSNDPQYLFGRVSFSRTNGATAMGGLSADVAAEIRRYFGRPFTGTGDLVDDASAQYLADWVFYTHNVPLTRLESLDVDPASNPSLWDFALRAEVGQRVRVIRRSSGANSGAGLTITLDFFIEQIAFDQVDADTGAWNMSMQLSPIGKTGQPGSFQPWILGDATYGQLGITTKLAP